MPTLAQSRFGDAYFSDVEPLNFGEHPASEQFDRGFDEDFSSDDTFFILVGSDSGLLLPWLHERLSGDGSRALIIETDALHEALAADVAESSIVDGTRLAVCAASDADAWLNDDELKPWLFAGRVLLVESLACRARRDSGYAALSQSLRSLLAERVHRAGVGLNMRLFIDTQLQNLADNRLPADRVGTIGTGSTALVVGGAPSLDEHLDWIVEHRERLFILAASRTVARLLDAGVTPDVVVAVDPQDLLYDISRAGLRLATTPLVSAYHVAPRLLQQWRGPTLYTGQALPWDSADAGDADNIPAVGSTVTHVALWLAYRWGFSQLLLSGMDLCYAPGGATHASGSPEALCNSLPINYQAQVTTYSGRQAGTATALKLGRDELEEMGEAIARDGVPLYNLARDAARVESIAQRDPDDVALLGARPALDAVIGQLAPVATLTSRRGAVDRSLAGLGELRRACRRAQALLDGLHGRHGRLPDGRCKRKLDALERTLQRRQGRWLTLAKRYAALELTRTLAPRGFDVQSDEELEAWGRSYYRILDQAAKRLMARLRDAQQRIDWRLVESQSHLDADRLPALLAFWRSDATLGRIHRLDLSDTAMDAATSALLRQARGDVETDLDTTDTPFHRALGRKQSDDGNVLRTVSLLFAANDTADLARLVAALPDDEGPRRTLHDWVSGQLAELQGHPEAALDAYRRVIDAHAEQLERGEAPRPGTEHLLEEALLRIVQLQLKSETPAQALDGLRLLAQIRPEHVAQLARLLTLLSRDDEAIAVLQEALEAGVGNRQLALQLADLYARRGATDAARLAEALAAQWHVAAAASESGKQHHAA